MIAILPIRAGSQRIKHKNITLINGKPLYMYIVNTLKRIEEIDKIIINTDYDIIHETYKKDAIVHVMARDNDIKGNCNINLVIERVLQSCNEEYFFQTHTTNPLLSAKTISSAIEYFKKHNNDFNSLFAVTKVQKRYWTEKSVPINHNIGDEPTTQYLDPMFEENSCIYIFSRTSFNQNKNRIGSKPCIFPISKIESIDIDEKEDLDIVSSFLMNTSITKENETKAKA